MSRRQKHGEHANHERWLVSYADFITLLFAFFVVMYSSSQVDKRKVGKIALAIQVAFQQMGLFPSSNSRSGLSMSEPMPFSQVQMAENVVRAENLGRVISEPKGEMGPATSDVSPRGIEQELEKALAPEIQRRALSVDTRREGVVVSLKEVGFFDSGSATVRPEAEEAVGKIAAILSSRPDFVRVEGHTDNVPIHTATFASNWELSTARATELVRLLTTHYGISANRLSVAGYAEFRPLASNATAEGRSINRRVDLVVVTPQRSEGAFSSREEPEKTAPPAPSSAGETGSR
jgi:chemotaxis protein MotB